MTCFASETTSRMIEVRRTAIFAFLRFTIGTDGAQRHAARHPLCVVWHSLQLLAPDTARVGVAARSLHFHQLELSLAHHRRQLRRLLRRHDRQRHIFDRYV